MMPTLTAHRRRVSDLFLTDQPRFGPVAHCCCDAPLIAAGDPIAVARELFRITEQRLTVEKQLQTLHLQQPHDPLATLAEGISTASKPTDAVNMESALY